MSEQAQNSPEGADRREFVAKLGRFAAVTPPAMTLLLHTTMNSQAVAASGGKGNCGFGNGANDGTPGNSGCNDALR